MDELGRHQAARRVVLEVHQLGDVCLFLVFHQVKKLLSPVIVKLAQNVDRIVWAVAAGLLAAIALVLWRGDQVGVPVLSTAPAAGSPAAASAPIEIEFGQRMNAASVQSHFTITPQVDGKFLWNENSLYFLPDAPLEEDQHYLVHLAKGAQGQVGHDLLADLDWGFDVRVAGVAFLRQAASGYELWAVPDLKGEPVQLSPADGVFDYTVA